jgi:cytochrome c oxidase subunit I+III
MKKRANPRVPRALHLALDEIWGVGRGWDRLAAVNHTIVGLRFILTSFGFFAIGGLLAMLIRAQLATPRSAFIGPDIYNQVFTMHGTVMMFLFVIPMIEGIAIYLLPKMLGARDMAFPRLSAYGYWCYLFGGTILLLALAVGAAPDAGWFMYVPLSSRPFSPGINSDVWLIGVTFVEISAISAAVEIVVSILKVRAPGMSLDRMPIFAWYMLVTAFMMLIGFPPLILASILLETERAFGWPFFDPTRGGDALLWQHLFWIFGHPEVYIIFLPGAAIVSTLLPVFAHRPLVGYAWVVVSIIALGFISFGLWVHHMFTVGIPHLALAFFSAASLLVVVPTGVQMFSWLATLISGRPELRLPMLFILGFFFIFVAGGLTGVMVAIVPFDWQVHDTHFVVAHFHYVLVGGFVFPMLAAAYYWLPNLSGRDATYRLGHAVFWMVFIGFNLTFLVMHLTGLLGMPRRIYTYDPDLGWEWPNLVSSLGGFLMTMGFAVFVLDMVLQLRYGRVAERNPWRADTLEWTIPVPPTSYGYASLPRVQGRRPLADNPGLADSLAAGDGYLGFTRNGWPETLGVHMVTGEVEQVLILPRPTHLPLYTALATGVFFVSFLFSAYWIAAIGLAATVALALRWTRTTGFDRDHGALPIGRGISVPAQQESASPPAWWGATFGLAADGTLFASLAFGALYLPVIAPGWPQSMAVTLPIYATLAAAAALAAAAIASGLALGQAASASGREAWLLGSALAQGTAVIVLGVLYAAVPDPTAHAQGALSAALIGYALFHAAMGIVLAGYGWWRSRAGRVSANRTLDLRIGKLWQSFTAVTGIAALALIQFLPWFAR